MSIFTKPRVYKTFLIKICGFRRFHGKNVPRIFSGIQPTGIPHIGNYFGAIKNWCHLQDENKNCVFSIVDLHSITLPQDPEKLRCNIHSMAACLLACGINPDSSTLFQQSQVPYHTELSWILGCLCTMAKLSHLPQYKEKSDSSGNMLLGLYLYPVLQSADILLYKAANVPVGEDQLQHIQLSQHLANVFNNRYGKVFPYPMPLVDDNSARIKSLRQPTKKMSKSDVNIKSRIELTDTPETITKKIKQAVTDVTSAVTYDPENRPGVSNLILIHSLCTGQSPETICEESTHLDTGQYKIVVADALVETLKPLRNEYQRIISDTTYINQVLKRGSEKASEIACKTMDEVKRVVGLQTKTGS